MMKIFRKIFLLLLLSAGIQNNANAMLMQAYTAAKVAMSVVSSPWGLLVAGLPILGGFLGYKIEEAYEPAAVQTALIEKAKEEVLKNPTIKEKLLALLSKHTGLTLTIGIPIAIWMAKKLYNLVKAPKNIPIEIDPDLTDAHFLQMFKPSNI